MINPHTDLACETRRTKMKNYFNSFCLVCGRLCYRLISLDITLLLYYIFLYTVHNDKSTYRFRMQDEKNKSLELP